MLGITTLVWGIMYLIMFLFCIEDKLTYPIFSGESLISSNIFICLMFLFPLEVLFPGWLNKKRFFLMLMPITTLAILYYVGLQITEQHIEDFTTFQDLWNSLGKFNVWYRLILLTCNLTYASMLLHLLDKQEIEYVKWQNENFSDRESVDISWMHYYKKIFIAVLISYLFVALWGSLWTINIHTLIVIISFSILFYKVLFHENPYPKDFLAASKNISKSIITGEALIVQQGVKMEFNDSEEVPFLKTPTDTISDDSFKMKLPSYVEVLKKWMNTEQPYLYKDFKLIDAARVLPLNRTYLSRVFNEGFHQSFSEIVRVYRIEHAKKIFTEHPSMTVNKAAEMCGFSSDSSFIKAFQKVTGMTPKQFKKSNES